jgi:hypothetical protein
MTSCRGAWCVSGRRGGGRSAARGSPEGRRRVADCQDAINERAAFTRLLREVDADPLMPGPAGSPLADTVAAVLAAAVAMARRWQQAVFMVSPWELALTRKDRSLASHQTGPYLGNLVDATGFEPVGPRL